MEYLEIFEECSLSRIRDIKVEDKNYKFLRRECSFHFNPIDVLFQYWEGDLKKFIEEIEFNDFIRNDGRSVDILRFEYALNGKEYREEQIKRSYNLIYPPLQWR